MKARRQLLRELHDAHLLIAEFTELAEPSLEGMGPTGGELIRLQLAVDQAVRMMDANCRKESAGKKLINLVKR